MNKPPLIVTRALILFGTPLLAVTLVPYYGFHVGFGDIYIKLLKQFFRFF